MSRREQLAREAVAAALRMRARHGVSPEMPVCPIDLALAEGVDVRFLAANTLEGMYSPDGPVIVLGSRRPKGRRAYNAAHELGHHAFNHGLRIDEIDPDGGRPYNDAEFVADRFAAALLMPKLAVLRAFSVRGWDVRTSDPTKVFMIAGVLGVGYTTLVGYLEQTLRLIDTGAAARLRRSTPKALRAQLLGGSDARDVVVVDEHWDGRAVDVEVEDVVILAPDIASGRECVEPTGSDRLRVVRPGRTQLSRGRWSAELRSMRAEYEGLASYRHLEDVHDDV